MSSSRSSTKYHIIQDVEQQDHKGKQKGICPKLSRYKLIALVFVSILSLIFIIISLSSVQFFKNSSLCSDNTSTPKKIDKLQHLPHTKRRLPRCIIIGARKAGTRALLAFLNVHPDIQAVGQEPHFFDYDEHYELGLDWYRKKMPYSYKNQITIEKTPSYFVEADVPRRVYAMNNTIKLILIVKDPVIRAISDYSQFRENKIIRHKPVKTFESLTIDPETGEINRSYNAVRRSIYYRHMLKWLKYFDFDQIHIVDGDKLTKAPWREIHKVETFLDLKHVVTKDKFVFNETRGFYCLRNTDGSEKCLSQSKGRKHPYIQPWIKQKLRVFFYPFNVKFFKLTDRDFGWNDGFSDDENFDNKHNG